MPNANAPAPTRPTAPLPFWRSLSALPFALLAGVAMSVSLSACGPSGQAAQANASAQMNQAGSDLKAAVNETGSALNAEAQAAKPDLQDLKAKTNEGVAKLADATGDAAAKAGAAVDNAAHKAGDTARAHNDNTQTN